MEIRHQATGADNGASDMSKETLSMLVFLQIFFKFFDPRIFDPGGGE